MTDTAGLPTVEEQELYCIYVDEDGLECGLTWVDQFHDPASDLFQHPFQPPAPQPVADREEVAGLTEAQPVADREEAPFPTLADVDEARSAINKWVEHVDWTGPLYEPHVLLNIWRSRLEAYARRSLEEQLAAVTAESERRRLRAQSWAIEAGNWEHRAKEAERQLETGRQIIEAGFAQLGVSITSAEFRRIIERALSPPASTAAEETT